METQTWLSCHNKFILTENITILCLVRWLFTCYTWSCRTDIYIYHFLIHVHYFDLVILKVPCKLNKCGYLWSLSVATLLSTNQCNKQQLINNLLFLFFNKIIFWKEKIFHWSSLHKSCYMNKLLIQKFFLLIYHICKNHFSMKNCLINYW